MAVPLLLEKPPQLPLTPYYDTGVNFLFLTPRIIRPVKMGDIENNPRLALKSGRPSPGTETQTRRGERGVGQADGVELALGSWLGRRLEEPPSDRLIGRETQSDGGGGRRTISLRGLAAAYTPGSGAAELG